MESKLHLLAIISEQEGKLSIEKMLPHVLLMLSTIKSYHPYCVTKIGLIIHDLVHLYVFCITPTNT